MNCRIRVIVVSIRLWVMGMERERGKKKIFKLVNSVFTLAELYCILIQPFQGELVKIGGNRPVDWRQALILGPSVKSL